MAWNLKRERRSRIVCCYCHGRVDRDAQGLFYHQPFARPPFNRDEEPTEPGDVCCTGPESRVYQLQVAGYSEVTA
jgi:hypothetical protein